MSPDMTTALIALTVCGLVLLVSAVQRVAGFGFGLVMAPFLVVLLDPHEGVMLANLLSLVPPLFIMWELRSHIEWRKFLWLSLGGLAIMMPAAWVSVQAPAGPLYIVVGAVVLAGLVASSLFAGRVHVDGAALQTATGVTAGAGAVIAGVAAPPLTIYGMLSRWPLLPMIATMQPLWVVIAAASVGSKWYLGDGVVPGLPWWGWLGALVAMPLGIWIGRMIQNAVDAKVVSRFVVGLAVVGALLALVTGVRMTFF